MDTSDESSSLDSLELGDQMRYILKPTPMPKLHSKYTNSSSNNNNNNNNSILNNNTVGVQNKNDKTKQSTTSTSSSNNKCHIRITNDMPPTKSNSNNKAPASRSPARTEANSSQKPAAGITAITNTAAPPTLYLDPRCQEVVSGHITMVTVEGGAVAGQLDRLQGEITRLKVEKLELLRQNVAAQREVKHLRERELQLQADLSTASREINKLRTGLKQRLVRELPWPVERGHGTNGLASSASSAPIVTAASSQYSSSSSSSSAGLTNGTQTAAVVATKGVDTTWHI